MSPVAQNLNKQDLRMKPNSPLSQIYWAALHVRANSKPKPSPLTSTLIHAEFGVEITAFCHTFVSLMRATERKYIDTNMTLITLRKDHQCGGVVFFTFCLGCHHDQIIVLTSHLFCFSPGVFYSHQNMMLSS